MLQRVLIVLASSSSSLLYMIQSDRRVNTLPRLVCFSDTSDRNFKMVNCYRINFEKTHSIGN